MTLSPKVAAIETELEAQTFVMVDDTARTMPPECPHAMIEMLCERGERTLNRTTFKDGAVRVTAQGPDNGPWLRTQAEWDARTAGVERRQRQ